MNQKQSLGLIIGTALAFTVYELIGHLFLMAVPMAVRHGVSILIGTTLAVFIAAVSVQAIWRQQEELKELARLRDYLLLMQSHYLRLPPSARTDPRQQLEYQALELDYSAVQHRLAAGSPAARASALLDLSELALTHLPSMEAPYPFFPHAASHLAAALYIEADPLAREEALHSLNALAAFARDNEPNLLPHLIDNLAHVNRTTYAVLVDALSVYVASVDHIDDAVLTALPPHVRFTPSEETDTMVLRELIASRACKEAIVEQRVLRKADITPHTDEAHAVRSVRCAASALRDSRDALAQTLGMLSAPVDFPSESAAHRFWKRVQPLALRDCFLVGADLSYAHLHGADLRGTYLSAALLTDARMPNADMSESNLRKAHLVGARLQYAKLWGANLQDSSLTTASLEGADLSRARLQGAYLIGTDLKGACLWQIAIADDAKKREHCAIFTEANWWEARFTDVLSGSTDTETQTWLKFTYPRLASEVGTIPKVPVNPFTHA
jgi:uncharacterized protein YjbI with pentapeptide repeats